MKVCSTDWHYFVAFLFDQSLSIMSRARFSDIPLARTRGWQYASQGALMQKKAVGKFKNNFIGLKRIKSLGFPGRHCSCAKGRRHRTMLQRATVNLTSSWIFLSFYPRVEVFDFSSHEHNKCLFILIVDKLGVMTIREQSALSSSESQLVDSDHESEIIDT